MGRRLQRAKKYYGDMFGEEKLRQIIFGASESEYDAVMTELLAMYNDTNLTQGEGHELQYL